MSTKRQSCEEMSSKKCKLSIGEENSCQQEVKDAKDFDNLFPVLLDDLIGVGMKDLQTSDAFQWFKRVLEYNVPHGKRNRGLTVIHSYRHLSGENDVAEEGLKIAGVLGWCVELLQAFFLVADDIMDSSSMRRGQPCWYVVKEVGLTAINDSFYLENAIYMLLKKYIREKPYYADILDLFHEITIQTITGQNLDLITAPVDKVDLDAFTLDRYEAIVKYKTAFYSFYLPVACAMYMTGIHDPELHEEAKAILLKMGEYFQIQDDYLDCYGDPKITGKVGTDIEDNKCSWLVVQALTRVTADQKALLKTNYGKSDPEKVRTIKELFNTLEMESVYRKYEEDSYNEIMDLINGTNRGLPKEMFISYVRKIYKRNK